MNNASVHDFQEGARKCNRLKRCTWSEARETEMERARGGDEARAGGRVGGREKTRRFVATDERYFTVVRRRFELFTAPAVCLKHGDLSSFKA
jgi:hypothetical protein